MKTFKNKSFVKRDYEATNIVFCQAETAPNENWVEVQIQLNILVGYESKNNNKGFILTAEIIIIKNIRLSAEVAECWHFIYSSPPCTNFSSKK